MFDTKIPFYSIILIFSLYIGLIIIYKNMKLQKFKSEEIYGLLVYILMGSIIGAKLLAFIINYQEYKNVNDLTKVGNSSLGAVIGIALVVWLFSLQLKKNFFDLIYHLMPAIPLMYGLAKIGCFITGCCYGIKYNGLFSITYNYSLNAPKGVNLFPVQLVESIIFIILFIIIENIYKKNKNKMKVMSYSIISCSLMKCLLDFMRMSHKGLILSNNQIICIIFIIIGVRIRSIKHMNQIHLCKHL